MNSAFSIQHSAIFLVGFMASGKTTVGAALAKLLHRRFVDLDDLIVARVGCSIGEFVAREGEERFRQIETEVLRETANSSSVISPGGGAITRAENRELMARAGVMVWLDAPFELCWQRIKQDAMVRPLAATEEAARERYEQRLPLYQVAAVRVVVAEEETAEEIAAEVVSLLDGRADWKSADQADGTSALRLLIRGTNWLGDAVMTAPAMERLRASFPDAHIALLATPLTAGLFQGSPLVNEVIEYRRRENGVKAFFDAVGQIRQRRFDLALLFQNAFEAALLASLGGIKQRIGFAEQGRSLLLTHKLHRGAENRNRHQTNDYLDIVAECERVCLGEIFKPANEKPLPSLVATSVQRRAAKDKLVQFAIADRRPLIALNTGATNSRAKCWPANYFAELADRLAEELNAQIVLIGGAAEREYADNVFSQITKGRPVNLAGKTSMPELIGLLAECDLLVSNDTGPAHVAAALGTPTLTIFGPTNEFETSPSGLRSELIRADGIECARCMHRDCPIDHRCMTRIAANDVLARARKLLQTKTV